MTIYSSVGDRVSVDTLLVLAASLGMLCALASLAVYGRTYGRRVDVAEVSEALRDLDCPYCGGVLTYSLDLTPYGPGSESEIDCDDCDAVWNGYFKAVRAPKASTLPT